MVVAVKVAARDSNAGLKEISLKDLNQAISGATFVLELYESLEKLVHYVETRMFKVAPNLCEVVGKTIAAKLISAAGGLHELARTPACNIQVIGSKKRVNLGLAKKG